MTSLDTAHPTTTSPGRRNLRPAAVVTFGLLVVAQVAIVTFALWEPPFDGSFRYDDIAPVAGAYWPMHVLLGGPGYALSAVTASVFLAVLGAGRGNVTALAGTVVHLLAGLVFALVITAEVLPFAWAARAGEDQARPVFALFNDDLDAYLPYVLAPMALIALGALVALTGAVISGNLGRWVPVVAVVIVVGIFALPPGSPLAVAPDLAQRALWIYIGWRGLKALDARA